MGKKLGPLMSPKKLVSDMVAGKTLEEALTVTESHVTEQQGDTNMSAFAKTFATMMGQPVIVHTVTYAWAGRLVSAEGDMIVLEDATWVADLGQISKTFKDCTFNESEYIGQPVALNCQSIIYATVLPEMPKRKGK